MILGQQCWEKTRRLTIAARVMTFFYGPPLEAPPQLFPELTERERGVLALMPKGTLTQP
jgi:hypothetical protein